MQNNLVHLHLHTSFSIKDGVASVDDYIKKAEEYGMPALAITDHGSIGSFPKFYIATQDSDVKPIFGVEIYMQNDRDKLEGVIENVSKYNAKVKDINKLIKTKRFTKQQWGNNKKIMMKAFKVDHIDSDVIKECNKDMHSGKQRLKKILKIFEKKHTQFVLERDRLRKNQHLTLLAKNITGFKNIISICNDASMNGFYYKPRAAMDFITKHKSGLIILSGCLAGPLNAEYWKYIRENEEKFEDNNILDANDEKIIFDRMCKVAQFYKETFEHFFIEIMLNNLEDQKNVNRLLLRISNELDIDYVITNDVHYVDQRGAKAQEISLLLGSKDEGKQVTMKDKQKFEIMKSVVKAFKDKEVDIDEIGEYLENDDDVQRYNLNTEKNKLITKEEIEQVLKGEKKIPRIWGFSTTDFWFRSYDEMIETYKENHTYLNIDDIETGLKNTLKVANLVKRFELDLSVKLPIVDTGNKSQFDYLIDIVKQGWKDKIKGKIKNEKLYKKRLITELNVIDILDIAGYLIIVADYINWSKHNDILVGCGRGSSAGSLVCYLMNITEVDPIEHNLLFERFISVARSTALYDFQINEELNEKVKININKEKFLQWKNNKKLLRIV